MRIKKYKIDPVVDPDDILIGSDSANVGKPTRNYRIGDLIDFIRNEGTLSGLSYQYSDGGNLDVSPDDPGIMTTDSNYFKQITEVRISPIAFSKKDYAPALNTFLSNESILKISSPSTTDYGFYKVNHFAKDSNDKHYKLTVELIKTFGHGELLNEYVYEVDLEPLISAQGVMEINHNNTKGIQGGNSEENEYYHLTKKQLEALEKIIENAPSPTYIAPSLILEGNNRNVEMGDTIQSTLTSVFTQNDAGALLETNIERRYDLGGWEFMIKDTTIPVTETELRQRVDYRSKADYDEGDCKENELGEEDCTGRIQSGSIHSNFVTVRPYYKYFFGDSDSDIILSADVRGLAISDFDFGGDLDIEVRVEKGKTQFFFFIRSNRTISKIVDLSIQGVDVTIAYKESSETFSVEDAGGELVSYKKYKFNLSDGYEEDHIHRISLKNN